LDERRCATTIQGQPLPDSKSPSIRLGLLIATLALLTAGAFAQQPSGGLEQEPESLADPRAMEFYANAATVVNLPMEEAVRRIPHLRGMQPAGRQDELREILAGTGKAVKSFFQDFPNTASDERIVEEYQASDGMYQPGHSERFRYLALNRDSRLGPGLEEFRTDAEGNRVNPGGSFTTLGFVSTSAIFHPEYQSEAIFRLLGRQKVRGRETVVVGFAQIPGRARFVGKAIFGGSAYVLTLMQGVAWILPGDDQIIRVYTSLLAPRPDIGLKLLTTDINYEKVRFKSGAKTLWLPHEVVVTEAMKADNYRSVHTYSNFRLFTVEAGEMSPAVK
jgi:hypothetical protein